MVALNKVLVVGGGIGGLSAGIALRQAGVAVDLVEVTAEYHVYGVGIIQPANALRALDALGVAGTCIERGSPYDQFDLYQANGTPLGRVGTISTSHLPSHNGISRRILHEVLHEQAVATGVQIRMGTTVTDFVNGAESVMVTFSDGTSGTYDFVVAADGINSKMRQAVFPDCPKPRYTGQSVWRYAFPRPPDMPNASMFFNKQTKAGLVPMTKDTMYMFLVSSEGDDWFIKEEDLIPRFKAHLAQYSAPAIAELVPCITDPKGVVCRPLETVLLPAPWHRGRILMMGDAAHGTIPQLGQGAALAIEDGVVLGDLVQTQDSVEAVFEGFMRRRFERSRMVVNVSNQIGDWEQLEWQGQALPEGVNIGQVMNTTFAAVMEAI